MFLSVHNILEREKVLEEREGEKWLQLKGETVMGRDSYAACQPSVNFSRAACIPLKESIHFGLTIICLRPCSPVAHQFMETPPYPVPMRAHRQPRSERIMRLGSSGLAGMSLRDSDWAGLASWPVLHRRVRRNTPAAILLDLPVGILQQLSAAGPAHSPPPRSLLAESKRLERRPLSAPAPCDIRLIQHGMPELPSVLEMFAALRNVFRPSRAEQEEMLSG
jgi:hypothetical protein